MRGFFLSTIIFVLFTTACNSTESRRLAVRGVDEFHSPMNSEEYHLIYSEADDAFHQAASEADLIALLQGIHQKLGAIRQSNLQSYQAGWFTGEGTRVALAYETEFANGSGSEQFVWHIRDGRPRLVRYNINSNALVTN